MAIQTDLSLSPRAVTAVVHFPFALYLDRTYVNLSPKSKIVINLAVHFRKKVVCVSSIAAVAGGWQQAG